MTTTLDTSNMRGQLNQEDALTYMFGGNATFTLVDKINQQRFTYKIQGIKPEKGQKMKPIRFCKLMTGKDNESNFTYFSYINLLNRTFTYKFSYNKTKISQQTDSIQLFQSVLAHLRAKRPLENVDIFHEGTCGCCGRKLTVPQSVHDGVGPECAKHLNRY